MASENIPELGVKTFDDFFRKGFVFVDFFAEWCMPCVMMTPVLEELNLKFGKEIKFGKVNIDDNPALAQRFGITSIPNMVLFKEGEEVDRFVGVVPKEELDEALSRYLE